MTRFVLRERRTDVDYLKKEEVDDDAFVAYVRIKAMALMIHQLCDVRAPPQ